MNPTRTPGKFPSAVLRMGAMLLLLVVLACGGGSSMHETPPGFSLSVPSLDLANSAVGTVTVQINRTGGFQGAVSLTVAGTLPKGIKASFAPHTGLEASVELSIEAGYADPADPTFRTTIDPVLGATSLNLQGVSGAITATTTLNLKVTSGSAADFGLAVVNGTALDQVTDYTLHNGVPLALEIAPYDSSIMFPWASTMPSGTKVTLGATGLPKGLTASMPSVPVVLNSIQTLTLLADSTLAAGTYGFSLSATSGGTVRYLPMAVTVAPGLFWTVPPAGLTLAQGQSLTLPVSLGRADVFFQDNGGTDPDFVGAVGLSASTGTSAFVATFPDASPSRYATVPLVLTAGPALSPGQNTVTVTATRIGSPTAAVPSVTTQTFTVNVTQPGNTATTWIQKVEWGQSVLAENLKLVPGKPALLRVHLLADRTGVPAPVVTATVRSAAGATLDTLTLTGPATVPCAVAEGTLAHTYTVLLPGADIAAGMKVAISAGTASLEVLPSVETKGFTFNLKLVPIVHKGLTPTLPADADVRQALLARWPIQEVAITRRAPYTTATVVPPPLKDGGDDDHAFDGWSELLAELTALKAIDNSSASYYGIFNADLGSLATGVSAYVGLHYVGYGAGIGIDTTTAAYFGGAGQSVETLVHELGHGFNLNHAPVGGAGGVQLNYPYQGGSIGTFGYNPYTGTLYDPATTQDIMGYKAPAWVSDWSYEIARHFVESAGSFASTASPLAVSADHLVVSGWMSPSGAIHLGPMARARCKPVAAGTGPFQLALTSASGTRKVAFAAAEIGCLPKGYRAFIFTVPAEDALTRVEVLKGDRVLFSRRPLAARMAQVAAEPVLEERDGVLRVTWDAQAMPYLSVVHEGAARTTLALRLQGGSAELPLDGLPKGGRFTVQSSDGLNHRQGPAQARAERQ